MSPQPPTLLDDLWESIPTGPAPVDDLVRRGRTRRRRFRLAVAGGAAALVVAAGVGISIVPRSDDHAAGVLTPPPGTRYVGIGQVVVAVPKDWADGAASCNSPVRNTVFFPWPQDCHVGGRRDLSSVAISSLPFQETGASRAQMKVTTEIDGNPVLESAATCTLSDPGVCRQTFGIPDLHAFFTVTSPGGDTLDLIRHSLTVLPDGQTTVPFVASGSPLEAWDVALRDAGLVVVRDRSTCPPNAFCAGGVLGTDPAPGTVVPTGSVVTLQVVDP